MRFLLLILLPALLAGCATPPPVPPPVSPSPATTSPPTPSPPGVVKPPRIALALGGGAARGFAHIGVIKALEAQGIQPDIVVGTSAGALVGALYAAGLNGFELQKLALDLEESTVADWTLLPNRGVLKGESLQDFVNGRVRNRPLERLGKTFAAVATNLASGEMTVFRQGNTGMAVRASSAVPGVFQPVRIQGREYVDGGLSSPVPVGAARELGADIVIAVDIGDKPDWGKVDNTLRVLLQTYTIMGNAIARHELAQADVVIRPHTPEVSAVSFAGRHRAILEGEKAASAALPAIKARLARWRGR